MKKPKVVITLIAVWQILLALACLTILSIRISNMTWKHQPMNDPFTHYYMGMPLVFWQWYDTYLVVFIIISLTGCIGLFLSKKWGRILSIISSVLSAVIFVIIFIWVMTDLQDQEFYYYILGDLLINYILPVLIALIVITISTLSIIYLNKPHIKEFFKSAMQIRKKFRFDF